MKKLALSLLSVLSLTCVSQVNGVVETLTPLSLITPDFRQLDDETTPYLIQKSLCDSQNWMAYGTFVLPPYANSDNPKCNFLGLEGESQLPYTVPEGYSLTIDYLQIEGPDGPQVGMALWLGEHPASNPKSIISCTTPGGSTQLQGMRIKIPSGKKVNIRIMNNTPLAWCNGFYLQGTLTKNE